MSLLVHHAGQPPGRSAPRVRSMLAMLVVACVFPMLLMAAWLIYQDTTRDRERVIVTAQAQAGALAAALDRKLTAMQSGLQVLATAHSLERGDLAAFYQRAKGAVDLLGASNVVLANRDGMQKLNTLLPYGAPMTSTPGPLLERSVFQTNRPALTDLFTGAVVKRPVFAMSVPARLGGEVVYSVNAGVSPERLLAVFEGEHLPPTWVAVIFDSTGAIVARSHLMDRFIGKQVVPELQERARRSASGRVQIVTLEGIPVITVFCRSGISNWSVAIGIPLEELTRPVRRTAIALSALTAVILGLALLLAWHVARRTTASIRAMMEPAKALSVGAIVHVEPQYFKEANEFLLSLASAALALQEARYESNHDPLTGLGNRTLFSHFVNQQVALAHRTRNQLALLYLDLDGFKAVNDTHGHHAGDLVLREVARRLRSHCRQSDLVVRLGGDEFALCRPLCGAAEAGMLASDLIEALSQPYPIEGGTVGSVSVSIGIASYPDAARDSESLIAAADAAMYEAKGLGKRRSAVAPKRND